MNILNSFCSNESHVKKATQMAFVPVETVMGKLRMEIPLCDQCYETVKSASFKSTTISV